MDANRSSVEPQLREAALSSLLKVITLPFLEDILAPQEIRRIATRSRAAAAGNCDDLETYLKNNKYIGSGSIVPSFFAAARRCAPQLSLKRRGGTDAEELLHWCTEALDKVNEVSKKKALAGELFPPFLFPVLTAIESDLIGKKDDKVTKAIGLTYCLIPQQNRLHLRNLLEFLNGIEGTDSIFSFKTSVSVTIQDVVETIPVDRPEFLRNLRDGENQEHAVRMLQGSIFAKMEQKTEMGRLLDAMIKMYKTEQLNAERNLLKKLLQNGSKVERPLAIQCQKEDHEQTDQIAKAAENAIKSEKFTNKQKMDQVSALGKYHPQALQKVDGEAIRDLFVDKK